MARACSGSVLQGISTTAATGCGRRPRPQHYEANVLVPGAGVPLPGAPCGSAAARGRNGLEMPNLNLRATEIAALAAFINGEREVTAGE